MAKTSRSVSKKTSASRAGSGKPSRASPRTASPSRTKSPSPRKAAKTTAKSTSRSAPGATKNAKPAREKRAKSKSSRIDVKVGSFGAAKPGSFGFRGSGGGLSFLSGKPGSAGAAGAGKQPRLTRTKLTARDVRHFRDLLLAKRRQLLGDMETMENEALRSDTTNLSHLPVHMADMGTDNYEQEFTLSLVDRDRQLIDEIDAALKKIDEKTYGICEGTGQMISRERLEAQPWARYSIEWARHLQRPGVRR